MAFDFKKEYKEFHLPDNEPKIINVPKANYIAVRGKGDPNEEGGQYSRAISILYAVAYTLKMSDKTDYKIEGFSSILYPLLRDFGGRIMWKVRIIPINQPSIGFLLFVCPILSQKQILIGRGNGGQKEKDGLLVSGIYHY